jgi:iron complex transport system ATP-binding protein
MDRMSVAVEFDNVSGGYRGPMVLRDVAFDVAEGQVVGILGPNGAGKTTLFRLLTGLLHAASGTVRVFGRDSARLPAAERARLIAVVPQEFETSVAFSVEEIVTMGRTASLSRWTPPSEKDRRIVERAMAQTDVVSLKHRVFEELSGGEKQRAVVAMALAQEPRVILMDEATSHLDMNHRLEVMQIVERLNREQNVTVLLISHDLNLAAEFCHRFLLLDHGRLVADGPPADVLTEDTLRRVYHCEVRVQRDAAGRLSVLPARRLREVRTGRGIRVHVVAGGGSGEEILRRLSLCGYQVSCGVLNSGDSDAEVAEALAVETATEKPFSPIGRDALDAAQRLAARADLVVVTDVPFGPGNVVNLAIAEQALESGRRVLMIGGIENRDYTPAGEAAERGRRLLARGAVAYPTLADLMAALPACEDGSPADGGFS